LADTASKYLVPGIWRLFIYALTLVVLCGGRAASFGRALMPNPDAIGI
jgi:hypothetical protein